MPFSDFHRLSEVVKKFKLQTRNRQGLFAACPEIAVGEMVTELLKISTPLATAIDTEKARSEMIVAPLLTSSSAAGQNNSCSLRPWWPWSRPRRPT